MLSRALSIAFLVLLLAGSLEAQVVRTWVSTEGSDANPCSRQFPCRNFAAAVTAVDPGGEVVVIDSGGYGAVSINKPVTLVAPAAVHAAIAPTAGTAIDIGAHTVTIRNLYLKSRGAPIGIVAGGKVFLDSVTVDSFPTGGIVIQGEETFLENCTVRNNGDGLASGDPIAVVRVHINNSRFERNTGAGVAARNFSEMTVRDTVSTSNGAAGFEANSLGPSPTRLTLINCQSARNAIGVIADGDTQNETAVKVWIAHSAVVYNTVGLSESDGDIFSQGNNVVEANGMDVNGTISTFISR